MITIVLIMQAVLEIILIMLANIVILFIAFFIIDKIKTYYDNWKTRRWCRWTEKNWEEYQQRKRKKELHKKEMEKYPLFYWRELSDGNT